MYPGHCYIEIMGMEDGGRSRWVSTGAGPMLCLGMQSMCRTVSRSVTPPPAGADCMLEEHWPLSRGWPRPPARPGQVASQTVQTAHRADTTSSTYPTHCAILCQILHRNNLDQTKETKKMEKKNLYLFVSQARNIHPVIHLSCLILNRIKQN